MFETGDPTTFPSHLPIPLDGTCNGLQHLSLMGRDRVGAEATNCANIDERRDLYIAVRDEVRKLVSADAVAQTPLDDFSRDLTALASSFGPETDVVLLTAWSGGNDEGEGPYVDEIRAVAAATAASLVDLTDLEAGDPGVQQQVAERVLAATRSS